LVSAVQIREVLLAALQLGERAQQLLVLALDLLEGVVGGLPRELGDDASNLFGADRRGASGEQLLEEDGGAATRGGADVALVHDPAHAEQPEPHTGLRAVAAFEDGLEIRDAGPLVRDVDDEDLRGRAALEQEAQRPSARVAEGVPADLGDRGRDARLVEDVEG
jgi:hypothetical protein